MSLNELVKLVAPPTKPVHAVMRDLRVTSKAGRELALPHDLKQFGATYGDGMFRGNQTTRLYIRNPFTPDFAKWSARDLDRLRDSKDSSGGEGVPYPIFPEEGGLFPLGEDDQGTRLWWRTVGDPDSWPIIVQWFLDPDAFKEFSMCLTHFMVALLTRQISLPPWPEPWFRDEVVFVPE
jgi:hypothetical protein